MIDHLRQPDDEFGFDINSVFEFLMKNVEDFEPVMVQNFFNVTPDDPLMNMGWGARPNYQEEISQLKKLKASLRTQARKFEGKLGVHEAVLTNLNQAAIDVTDYSLQKYNDFFGHENRGKPNWAARTVARLCYVVIKQCGRIPTLGTAATSDSPTGEYCRLVEGALKAADLDAHWNSPAIWAHKLHEPIKK